MCLSHTTQDNESSTIYLGWIALFVVGVFLIYIACAGIHAARRVRACVNACVRAYMDDCPSPSRLSLLTTTHYSPNHPDHHEPTNARTQNE